MKMFKKALIVAMFVTLSGLVSGCLSAGDTSGPKTFSPANNGGNLANGDVE